MILGLWLFGILLVYQLTVVIRSGLADLYAAPAIVYLLDQQETEVELTPTEWQALEANLNRALALAPHTPRYLSNLGWLQQIRLTQEEDTLSEAERARLEFLAYDLYARAAALRPTWPYDWGDMAIEKYRQAEYASEAYHAALTRAARFGPWKDDEQLLIAELGTDTWSTLTPGARQAVLDTIDRALERQPDELIAIVDRHRAWGTVCEAAFRSKASGDAAAPKQPGDRAAPESRELAHLSAYCEQDTGRRPSIVDPANQPG
jgi:hypothetical protein